MNASDNVENKYPRFLYYGLVAFFSLIVLSACTSAPKHDPIALSKVKSITIVCCDFPDQINVLPESRNALKVGFATAVVIPLVSHAISSGRFILFMSSGLTSVDTKLPGLNKAFLDELINNFQQNGVETRVVFPRGYNGAEMRYDTPFSPDNATDAILELRYIANIANTDEQYFPSIAVSYRFIRTTDQVDLARSFIASYHSTITPKSYGSYLYSTPSLHPLITSTGNLIDSTEFLPVPAERIKISTQADEGFNLSQMEQHLISTNRELAQALVKKLRP